MKKATIARFVIGGAAIFAAFGLAACGAESGQGASEEIGSSSAALTSIGLGSTYDAPAGLQYAASCVIHDGFANVDKLLVLGGFNSTGTAQRHGYLLTPGTGWVTVSNLLLTARGHAKMLPIPGSTNQCLIAGGSSDLAAGTPIASADSEIITINPSNGNIGSVAATGALGTPRAKFAMLPCAGNKIIAFAGKNAAAVVKAVEVFDPSAGTWSSLGNVTNGRYDVAAAANGTASAGSITAVDNRKFIVAGGASLAGSAQKDVDLITVDSSCATPSITSLANKLGAARMRAVAFPSGVTDKFIVAGGDNAGVLNTVDTLTVDWTTTSNTTSSSATATNFLATSAPAFATEIVSSLPASFFLVSGISEKGGTGSTKKTLAQVLKYVPGNPGTWTNVTSTVTDRTGLAAEFLDNGSGTKKVYATTGVTWTNGSDTYPVTTNEITP